MKKLSYLWTLLLALMVGVSFVSCDDDDEGDVGAPKELLGTWLWLCSLCLCCASE